MVKKRKLLRVGTPIPLASLRRHLEEIPADVPDAIVRHQNGELIVEAPVETLDVADEEGDD